MGWRNYVYLDNTSDNTKVNTFVTLALPKCDQGVAKTLPKLSLRCGMRVADEGEASQRGVAVAYGFIRCAIHPTRLRQSR